MRQLFYGARVEQPRRTAGGGHVTHPPTLCEHALNHRGGARVGGSSRLALPHGTDVLRHNDSNRTSRATRDIGRET